MRPWFTPSGAVQRAIRLYQLAVSSRSGGRCRFRPTCSEYSLEAFGKHGAFHGTWLAVRRIGRCHPLSGKSFQFDPVPERDLNA